MNVLLSALLVVALQAAPSEAGKQAKADLEGLKASIQKLMDLRQQQEALAGKAQAGTPDEEELKKVTAKHQELQKSFLEVREKTIKSMEELLEKVSKAIEKTPEDADLLEVRAEANLIYKAPEKALPDLEKLAKLRPEDCDLALKLGRLQHAQNRYEAAGANLTKFLKKTPADLECRLLLALCDYAMERFEQSSGALGGLLKEEKLAAEQRQRIEQFKSMSDTLVPVWKQELEIRGRETKSNDLPHVTITTSRGVVDIELFENEAPNTVANFIELSAKKFYDGMKFHRVIPGFMVQGGCPKGDGSGDAGYRFKDELKEGHRRHFRGSLSMANSGPDTNGSQFFITHLPTEWLNGKHTVFGRVVKGQDVVDGIQAGDLIVKAEVSRKRPHEYAVKKLADESGIPELKPEKKE